MSYARRIDRVHEHLADAGFALADAIADLPPDGQREAMRVVRLLTEAQERLRTLATGRMPVVVEGPRHRAD
jgi:hypothetical protein